MSHGDELASRGDDALPENGFNRFCAACTRILGFAGSAIIVLLAVVVCIQVFSRYVLNSPQAWSEVLMQYTFIWLTLLGAAMATRTKENLTVTFIYSRFTGLAGNLLQLGIDVVIIGVAFLWLKSSVLQIGLTWDSIEAGLNIRLGMVYLVFPLAFGLIMLFALEDMLTQYRRIRRIRRGAA